jgi:hypothetical protein
MHLDRALAQLSEIHAQVLHSAVYRGYSARSCAATACIALLGAAAQANWLPDASPQAFTAYWSLLALCCALLCVLEPFVTRADRAESWQRTQTVLLQLLPPIAVGALLPWLLLRTVPAAIDLLPGAWAALFGLGILASRPYLPRAIGWVGLYYLTVGAALALAATPGPLSPWHVGLPFALGQAGAAAVLWFQLERMR